MVQPTEILARAARARGFIELAGDLAAVAEKHRGKSPDVLEGVVVYDRSLEAIKQPQTYSNAELTYDLESNALVVEGIEIRLANLQHGVLRLLIQNADEDVPFGEFDRNIWRIEDDRHVSRLVRKHIHHIQRKVKDATGKRLRCISPVYGVGYRMVDPSKRKIHGFSSV